MKTIALTKPLQHAATGTAPSHHVLAWYQADLVNKVTTANLLSFMSAEAKQAVANVSVQMPGVPEGDGAQWVYDQILAAAGDGNALAGATAVQEA
jgi:hypothetical protein